MNIIRPVEITDTILVASDVPETDAAEYNPATTYAVDAEVMRTTAGVHSIYVSLQGSNTGNLPEDDNLISPVYWARKSATNRWAMFSDQISDKTGQADVITVTLRPSAVVNAMSLFNLRAQSVNITVDDPTDGEVYNKDFNLVDSSGVNTWYMWYFEPIIRQETLGILDLPPYSTADIIITISSPGSIAACGLLTMGIQQQIGETDYGTGIGIVDYSTKERDTFGNPVVINRNFSKRADYAITVDTGYVDTIQSVLASLRVTPLTWIGSTNFPSTILYGYYRDFNVVLSNPTKSQLSIEVEGLT